MIFNIEKSPWAKDNTYFMSLNAKFHETIIPVGGLPKVPNGFSYHFIIIKLFGLMPQDFFNYIRWKYHAIVEGTNLKTIHFDNLQDGYAFAKECERRFNICVNRGDFNYARNE